MAMPWSRAKAMAIEYRSGKRDVKELTALFDACFRIQRGACEAAGHHIPLIVENVRGAQPWVGRARWNFGSFYLWGDVPALMPTVRQRGDFRKSPNESWNTQRPSYTPDHAWKSEGMNWSDRTKHGQDFTRIAGNQAIKNNGDSWFNVAHNTISGKGQNPDGRKTHGHVNKRDGYEYTRHLTNQRESDLALEGIKQRGSGREWFAGDGKISRTTSSGSSARKAASAMIAKIPLPLSRYIASVFKPRKSC